MPLPTAAELTDPNATNTQMKQRLGLLAENVASKEEVEIELKSRQQAIKPDNAIIIDFTGFLQVGTIDFGTGLLANTNYQNRRSIVGFPVSQGITYFVKNMADLLSTLRVAWFTSAGSLIRVDTKNAGEMQNWVFTAPTNAATVNFTLKNSLTDAIAFDQALIEMYSSHTADFDVSKINGFDVKDPVARVIAEDVAVKLVSFSARSGYVAGLVTNRGELLIGFRSSDGLPEFANGVDVFGLLNSLGLTISSMASMVSRSTSLRSGILAAIQTPDGLMPFYIDQYTGKPILGGVDILAEIEKIKNNGSASVSEVPVFPSNDIFAVGDSLTEGGTTRWPAILATLSGRNVYNAGIAGQVSRQIAARQGGVPARFDAFVIPATATPVVVTITNNGSPCSKGGAPQELIINGVIGKLLLDNSNVHTFTRNEAGQSVGVEKGTIGIPVVGQQYRNRILIIGSGRNSFRSSSWSHLSAEQLVQIISAMISYQYAQVKRAIVWSIPKFTDDTAQDDVLRIKANDALKAAFPEFYLDIAGWLLTTTPQTIGTTTVQDPFSYLSLTPTSQDLIDIANKLTPESFRVADGHFNDAGRAAIAYRFNVELQMRGWN